LSITMGNPNSSPAIFSGATGANAPEELTEAVRAVDHPRLAVLSVMASACYVAGRIEDAVRYADVAAEILGTGHDEPPFGIEGWPGGAYTSIGQPERAVELCRAQLARGRDTHTLTRGCLVFALTIRGPSDEASAVADGLVEAAEATRNPLVLVSHCWPTASPSATPIPTAP
jgi:hypothetical protein